jgi:hypothetical protein
MVKEAGRRVEAGVGDHAIEEAEGQFEEATRGRMEEGAEEPGTPGFQSTLSSSSGVAPH